LSATERENSGKDLQLEIHAAGIDQAIESIGNSEDFQMEMDKDEMLKLIEQIGSDHFSIVATNSSIKFTSTVLSSGIDEEKIKEGLWLKEMEEFIKAIPAIRHLPENDNKQLMTAIEIQNCVHSASTYVMVDSHALKNAKNKEERRKTIFKIGQTSQLLPNERLAGVRKRGDTFADTKYQMLIVDTFKDSEPIPYQYAAIQNGHDATFYQEFALFKKRHLLNLPEKNRTGQGDIAISNIFQNLVDEHPEDVDIMERLDKLLESPEPTFVKPGMFLYTCKFGCKPQSGAEGWSRKIEAQGHMWKKHHNKPESFTSITLRVYCPVCLRLGRKYDISYSWLKPHLVNVDKISEETASTLRTMILKLAYKQN